MNTNILIFMCIVASPIASWETVKYHKCQRSNKDCTNWGRSHSCDRYNCKNICWPDYFSCCDCDFKKKDKCFSSASEVTLENGKSIRMYELQLGDPVQTGNDHFYRASLKA